MCLTEDFSALGRGCFIQDLGPGQFPAWKLVAYRGEGFLRSPLPSLFNEDKFRVAFEVTTTNSLSNSDDLCWRCAFLTGLKPKFKAFSRDDFSASAESAFILKLDEPFCFIQLARCKAGYDLL